MVRPLHQLVIGLDIGTAGVRAVAVDETGVVVARGDIAMDSKKQGLAPGWHEQDPEAWWQATVEALAGLKRQLEVLGHRDDAVVAMCVDGTSGTLVCIDEQGTAVRPAIMHNDQRAVEEAETLRSVAASTSRKLGYRIAPSFAIAKILWLQRHQPGEFAATRWFAHQADFVSNRLCGEYGVTDYSNALKTGYDLVEECWPAWLHQLDGLAERLPPRVIAPASRIGRLEATVAASLGLPPACTVVSGATDGTAAFLASGASELGADNTTLGTTLVFKRLSCERVADDDGLVYSHRLPGDLWLPGAASNTGGEWIQRHYGDADLGRFDRQSVGQLPCDHIAYPLIPHGERFPFLAADARGFCHPPTDDPVRQYAANLQGTAFLERLSYQVLDRATGVAGTEIYATGGASRSDIWLQLRADVNGRVIHRPECAESAFGSAVMAASAMWHDDVWAALRNMARTARSFEPDRSRSNQFEERFEQFRQALAERGYIHADDGANGT